MNLTDLTETARCRNCKGTSTVTATCPDRGSYPALVSCNVAHFGACPRCSDHPGIDPDVIRHFCPAHDSLWYENEGMCERAIAMIYYEGFKDAYKECRDVVPRVVIPVDAT